jgi:hydrogenase expression/formation protein HypE
MNANENYQGAVCPIPKIEYDKILMAHGGGGTLTHQLIKKIFISQFGNEVLNVLHDSAILKVESKRLAFTTDSYVVNPVFFPGGNIGELAVYGTINDLVMAGAEPLFLSVSFILEEGFLIEDLWQIVVSMKNASQKGNVKIVTGDTKVVDNGKADKIFINTSGIGIIPEGVDIGPQNAKPGDLIILNGRIAEHGIAILSAREGIEFESEIISDLAPLNSLVSLMLNESKNIHVLRDPTRGGLASTLNEIAAQSNIGIRIYEDKIPIAGNVKAACEIFGLDPLYIANEGKLVAFIDPADAEKVLNQMHAHELGMEASIIGEVTKNNPKTVVMKTAIGTNRIIDMISGEQLPRIC